MSNAICSICEKEVETVECAFLLCEWTIEVWHGLDIGYKVDRYKVTSLDRWLKGVFGMDVGKKEEKMVLWIFVAMTCWQIWKERCVKVM